MDMARTLLMDLEDFNHEMNLSAEAVNAANYLRNRIHSKACNETDKTPFEVRWRVSWVRKRKQLSYFCTSTEQDRGFS